MKYYVYISDAKVDMLFPQVPHEIKNKVATEFGIDLKVFKASRKSESESDENRISRLEAVVAFIREFGNIGSVDKPDQFFEDTISMELSIFPLLETSMVYWAGRTEQTLLGLAGSAGYVLGGTAGGKGYASLGYGIAGILEKEIEEKQSFRSEEFNLGESKGQLIDYVGIWAEMGLGDFENYEFMAKRLTEGERRGENGKATRVLVGSPLYVAKAD
jgi:hypothetical protein